MIPYKKVDQNGEDPLTLRLMMLENTFSNDEAAITPADLDHLECAIGKKLPTPFKNHYLKYNGGVPERTYWVSEDFDEE